MKDGGGVPMTDGSGGRNFAGAAAAQSAANPILLPALLYALI